MVAVAVVAVGGQAALPASALTQHAWEHVLGGAGLLSGAFSNSPIPPQTENFARVNKQ